MRYIYRFLKINPVSYRVYGSILRTYATKSFMIFLLLFASLGYFLGGYVGQNYIETKDLCGILLTYDALVLSFSIASITIVIAMPSQEFTFFLARTREKNGRKTSPFQNLILSFFKVGIAHYFSLLSVAVLLIFYQERTSMQTLLKIYSVPGVVLILESWAFFLFGVALRDIAALGVLYSNYLAKQPPNSNP